jgi:hypothetical protein
MPEVLQDSIQVLLVSDAVIVEIEHARSTHIAAHSHEVLAVDDFVQVTVPEGKRVPSARSRRASWKES